MSSGSKSSGHGAADVAKKVVDAAEKAAPKVAEAVAEAAAGKKVSWVRRFLDSVIAAATMEGAMRVFGVASESADKSKADPNMKWTQLNELVLAIFFRFFRNGIPGQFTANADRNRILNRVKNRFSPRDSVKFSLTLIEDMTYSAAEHVDTNPKVVTIGVDKDPRPNVQLDLNYVHFIILMDDLIKQAGVGAANDDVWVNNCLTELTRVGLIGNSLPEIITRKISNVEMLEKMQAHAKKITSTVRDELAGVADEFVNTMAEARGWSERFAASGKRS